MDSLCWKPFSMDGNLGKKSRNRGQSPRKPNMTDSLCRKRKLADSFIPCDNGVIGTLCNSIIFVLSPFSVGIQSER